LSPGLSLVCMAAMGSSIPRTYLLGSCQPLHPHVCDFDYGRCRNKPQECRQIEKLHPEFVLYKQGTFAYPRIREDRKLTNIWIGLPFRLLRPQRTLFHRPVPPIFLVSLSFSIPPRSHQPRRRSQHTPTRVTDSSFSIPPYEPSQRGGIGAGAGE
jgi:hypothetical protein